MCSRIASALVFRRSAHSDARWMSGPSAIGSENGMPTSTASAPARAKPSSMVRVASSEGYPAVTNGISPVSPRRATNAAARREAVNARPGSETSLVAPGALGPVSVAVAVLQRRADVLVLDPEHRVRGRLHREVDALQEHPRARRRA